MRMRSHETAQERAEGRGWLRRGEEALQLVTLHQRGGPAGCMIHRSALSSSLAECTCTYCTLLSQCFCVFHVHVSLMHGLSNHVEILPCFCHLSQPACVHSSPYGHIWELACYHQLASRLIFKI